LGGQAHLPKLPVPREKIVKKLVIAMSALSLLAGSAPSFAATHCRDSKGKFVKCPAKPKLCRDAKGHFIKCKK
jgi:hypothetical protein